MAKVWKRYQEFGHQHFSSFSCYLRQAHLPQWLREISLRMRWNGHGAAINSKSIGYAIMPEHVPLLVGEPGRKLLPVGLRTLKLSVA
jgi:REP-associated tyrosine transposase